METYKRDDLSWISPIQEQALIAMNKFIEENNLKDGGTCIIGESIYIWIKPPRCRNPQKLVLIRQPFQGNNEEPLQFARKYLQARGVDCYYDAGRMD